MISQTDTGYASIDKPWLKYYTEEEQNYTIPECKIVDFLMNCISKYSKETALDYFGKKISYDELRNWVQITTGAKSASFHLIL